MSLCFCGLVFVFFSEFRLCGFCAFLRLCMRVRVRVFVSVLMCFVCVLCFWFSGLEFFLLFSTNVSVVFFYVSLLIFLCFCGCMSCGSSR